MAAEAGARSARVRDGVQAVGMSQDSAAVLRALAEPDLSSSAAAAEGDTARGAQELAEPAPGVAVKQQTTAPPRQRSRPAQVPRMIAGDPALRSARESLPVWDFRQEIVDAVRAHQVVIVEGETGCGKTTQVAQYIVEDAATSRTPCSVVCTQPRRISAIGVAERVAAERGEPIGAGVGYSVRLESRASSRTHLLFCTTGILLRRLESDAELDGTTHVVVDEVHERGVESDFLLLALRDLCQRRRDLKVVLMSATMDKDLFKQYFKGTACTSLTVPGRTFPVEDFFLEDVLEATGHVLDPCATWALGGGRGGKAKGKGSYADRNGNGSGGDMDVDAPKREDLSDWAVRKHYGSWSSSVQRSLREMDQEQVNYDLLTTLLRGDTLRDLGKDGSRDGSAAGRPEGVLVFLSGAKEIETAQKLLLQEEEFSSEPARSWILPLHGGLPPDEQKRVFLKPPAGVRKVVLCTNVAETSITIDDVGYVIDTCRMKELRYDAVRRMSSLEDTVVSRTNARQRRGRAGRVAPGLAVHLGLTRYRHDQLIDDHQPPEVRRVPLEQLVLRIHAVGLHLTDQSGKAASICARLLEPPKPTFVEKAVEQLVRLGAIAVDKATGREALTSLGRHLAALPLEARLGKLVLYGAAFGPAATDAALTVAAALTSRNPFLAPLEAREEAGKAKRRFADRLVGGLVGPSDHLAVLAAYQEWDRLPHQGDTRMDFCRANFISIKALQGMSELKRSLLETLSEAGFVTSGLRARYVAKLGRSQDNDGVLSALTGDTQVEACPPSLVSALLCAALFPQIATATMPKVNKPKKGKLEDQEAAPQPKPKLVVRDLDTGESVKVKIHPGSVSYQETSLSSPYMAYQELVKTTMLYARDVTPVPPLALALFGGPLAAGGDQGSLAVATLIVDGWIKLSVPADLQAPLLAARRRLDALLANWVGMREADDTRGAVRELGDSKLLDAIVQLLTMQTQSAPSDPSEEMPRRTGRKSLAAFANSKPPVAGAGGSAAKRKRSTFAARSAPAPAAETKSVSDAFKAGARAAAAAAAAAKGGRGASLGRGLGRGRGQGRGRGGERRSEAGASAAVDAKRRRRE
eukprot:TRINITY_DN15520_c0_g3_i3.p1 TRINITY_DN15520_c0_g3~~TRINITY_DN15520_c0_g3_i3.p1  ORF type:complete len:1251 (+),score=251.33 TRINITY_DN15520_c0_g3_i3:484-3753(+)